MAATHFHRHPGGFPGAVRALVGAAAVLVFAAPAAADPAPVHTNPADTASDVSIHPTLEIVHVGGLSAQYQVSASAVFSTIDYDSGETGRDVFSHVVRADLAGETLFHWRARVKSVSNEWSDWSVPTRFTTAAAARISTHSLRSGEAGYSGAADTDIRGLYTNPLVAIREWNQGAQDVIRLGRRPAGSATDEIYRSLVRFDLTPVGAGDPVINAWIEFTAWQHDDPDVTTRRVNLFEVYRSWGEGVGTTGEAPTEGEASWKYSEFPLTWATPGCASAADGNPLADRGSTPLVRLSPKNVIGGKTYWSSQAFAAAVQRHLLDPSQNRGFFLRCVNESLQHVINLASREHPDVSFRPRLVVETLGPPPNVPPVLADDAATTANDLAVVVDVLENDGDPDGGPAPLSIASVTQPAHGTSSIEFGRVRYEPAPGYVGPDSFRYTATDGEASRQATVRVTVLYRLWIEAESGEVTAPMVVASDDPAASGGAHVVVPVGTGADLDPTDGGGSVLLTFSVPVDASYAVWARAKAVDDQSDSLFVSVDGGAPFVFDVTRGPRPARGGRPADTTPFAPAGAGYPGWPVAPDGAAAGSGSAAAWVFCDVGARAGLAPIRFALTAGTHTLRFGHREDGAPVDLVLVTNDRGFAPGP